MKTFEEILKMDQPTLKHYLADYLQEESYAPIEGDGYLYAKGEIPVLVIAHLDRHPIHRESVKDILIENNRWTSPQGICGDDRCGVWMMMNLIKECKVSVLFCEDEELECAGAKKLVKTDLLSQLSKHFFLIELDRAGATDAVFYTCHNQGFIDWILQETGYTHCTGTYSDISEIMPATNLAGVNLSCGYYEEHSSNEYILYDEMMHTLEVVKTLIQSPTIKKWSYQE